MTRRPTEGGRKSVLKTAVAACSVIVVAALLPVSGCSPDPTIASVRSLQGSGATSFVCLGDPAGPKPLHRLEECTRVLETDRNIDDFGTDVEVPHLYSLITQSIRGEVAVVDVSADQENVLDQDPSSPGANFLQVGESPTSIVSSPGGTASFVAAAEIRRPAIYALPNAMIRPCGVDPSKCGTAVPTISSWPACVLPAPPGAMLMMADPAQDGQTRSSCGGDYADPTAGEGAFGSIDQEGFGRQKLVVALPSLGQLVVIDAQSVLEATPGSVDACPIEETLTLTGHVEPATPGPPPGPPTPGSACVNPENAPPSAAEDYLPRPASMVAQDAKIYAGDLAGPVVHVVDAQSPCNLTEIAPFIARSRSDPTRKIVTTDVAVSPRATSSFKRYLYAVDIEDKSVMVFDASDGSTTREPLMTPNGQVNPLEPDDRVRFSSAPKQIQIVSRDAPQAGSNHVAPFGTLCNPDQGEDGCTDTSPECLGTLYRTDKSDYESGAGPVTLRGTFALVGLSSGQIGIIDIEDFDAPCRTPVSPTEALGCPVVPDPPNTASGTDEQSCGVIEANLPRSANYVLSNDTAGRHIPGISTFPLLYNKDGALVATDPPPPQMTAPPGDVVFVNGLPITVGDQGTLPGDDGTQQNGVVLNLADPRVHTIDQEWDVTFEGAIPGFVGKAGSLNLAQIGGGNERELVDESAAFCHAGVLSEAAVREDLVAKGTDPTQVDGLARQLADRITVTNALPEATNPYWDSTGSTCNFEVCRGTFGDDTTPSRARDFIISEAFDDHVELEAPSAGDDVVKCCFPTLATYEVRPGSQWTVVGQSTGFLHHVIADPISGACRNSCDSRLVHLNGRVRTSVSGAMDKDQFPFDSPQFLFSVAAVASTSAPSLPCGDGVLTENSTEKCDDGNDLPFDGCESDCTFSVTQRDMVFKFNTEGSFVPLRVLLTNQDRPSVEVQSLGYLPSVDQIFLTDGALEGLLLVNGTLVGDPKQFF